jgi:hypothetical protein
MNSSGNLLVSESTRRVQKSKARRKTRSPRGRRASATEQNGEQEQLAAPGSLTRTKALLLAALRVWELKHRIGD